MGRGAHIRQARSCVPPEAAGYIERNGSAGEDAQG